MAMYGYIRTSRDQEADRPGMNPETQRRGLLEAGVPDRNIHARIDVSGVAGVATRNACRSVDAKLEHGDILVVVALDRIGRRSLDVMGKIYDLVNRGVRLRSLADNEAWAKGLDADPAGMEWMTAMLIAQVCSFSAQLERQAIARRTRAGLARARAEGKRLGRPVSLDDDQMRAIHQDLAEDMTVLAISGKYGIPRTTLRDNIQRVGMRFQLADGPWT